MKIDKFIDEFNLLEQQNKIKYLADLQKKADNGDMTALFLTGYLQISPDWAVMKKAALSGDPELYYACICAKTADFGISPAKEREIHQLCYRGRKMNYAPVLNRLAITYLCGIGCKQNLKLAKKYFSQAAELGVELARKNLEYLTLHND
ncbi:MAG: SEL1-like repeat protein, partial [Lentisphaeria bacterium]|nr:SEL1-like repeat protein [Lentisphaeria bacterium]